MLLLEVLFYSVLMSKVQDLQTKVADQYKDLRDTALTVEAMKADTKPPVSWKEFQNQRHE